MFTKIYQLFLVILIIALTVGCASTKKEQVSAADSDERSRLDETFDPLSLNDDDIEFKEPEVRKPEESPQYLPMLETEKDSIPSPMNELIEGFRVQLLSTKDLENATRAKSIAMEQFSDVRVKFYLEFDSPYYKVRLGDFKTREEAEYTRELVRSRGYPKAWIVKSKIWSNPEFPSEADSIAIDSPEFE
jgi:hypothetical protein